MTATQKLNILQVASHKNVVRGGAVQMALLTRELLRRGHRVVCVFNKEGEVQAQDLTTISPLCKMGVPVEFFDMRRLREIWRFRHWLKEMNFDVIHTHRQEATIFVWLATFGWRKSQCPVIVAQRGTVYTMRGRWLEKWAYSSRRIDKIIAVAEAVKDSLVRNDGIPADKVEVVYGGVDEERFHPLVDASRLRKEFHIPPHHKVITTISALVQKKGLPDFFTAVAEVVKEIPDVKILVVGSGKKTKFDTLLTELNIKDHVLFTGYRQDVPEIIAVSDVIVCSSTKGEGLTGSLREALAMKKPVVSTDVAGNRELVVHEHTGLLVPPGQPHLLAQAILRVLRDKELASTLARQGYQLIQEKFLNSLRTDKIENIYNDLLRQKATIQASH
ncbi:glycosyltransferase family 4 protein [Candidatus Sumerlaeota bacterium]|nr:glycosyltransferase family 4 protein [Candidatus Sumerlaeota bacterium]